MSIKKILCTVAAVLTVALLFIAKELPVAETGEQFDRNRAVQSLLLALMFILISIVALCKYTNLIINFCLFLLIGCSIFTVFKFYYGTIGEPKYSDYTFIFGIALLSFYLAFRKPINKTANAGKSAANNLYMKWHQRNSNKTYGKDEL